ncbi:citramalate synthase [Streptomyces sp. NP160]|uniref:citramalate synthase n=1 Tax=Streptomyces sp. NP160 TaxID=2586637 RepID=UPI001118EDEA|nr:citramalate synthase [Streptomyces sp. NP160]TNM68448.1 citramalate synthase [Streptomyces sp. NP160]
MSSTTPTPTADAVLPEVQVYDTTLRDGAQQEGLNLSVADKLAIAAHLDELGVGFIEGGWPGANPRDTEFFARARTELHLRHAVLAAFGATRRAGGSAATDPQVQALLDAETPVVTIVAKSHVGHVKLALRTTEEENLAMVRDTVEHLVAHGRRVFLDAEHYFDGYELDRDHALAVVRTAVEAGAEAVVLCDTNGGRLPHEVEEVVAATLAASPPGTRVGMHAHNDSGCAVANSLAAVRAGATHVQGCVNGYGERTGNADLVVVVADLVLKLGQQVVPAECLREATRITHAVAEITNVAMYARSPYVGASAFAHKAGLHASAIRVDPDLYQHTDPTAVGNDMRMLVSDMAGRASIELKGRELGHDLAGDQDVLSRAVARVKELELAGWTFEAADASFDLLLREVRDGARPAYFEVESWRAFIEHGKGTGPTSEATVKLRAGGQRLVATGEGNGPVNALDAALRQALIPVYPQIAGLDLTDFRVRILDADAGTDATTRVLIDTTDGRATWTTVGVAPNLVEASWQALVDGITYGLLKAGVPAPEAAPAVSPA